MATITIITGSTLGGAEYVGDHLADLLQAKGHHPQVVNEGLIDDVLGASTLLIVTSTHGAGDFPDSIAPLMEQLITERPMLRDVHYGVVGIGDSSYDTFCEAGMKADALLQDLGAIKVGERIDIDIQAHPVPEDEAERWLTDWEPQLHALK
ncbi:MULTISPECIES: FMN-binding protein MioC [Salinivibrio]|uniref:FMN-binding protein MioC n=2 Tax=Salinivibrio TaxID=51366 RepID=A0ABX3K965_9GAMM|nr:MULTISPECIES: FMN-binding protein MioC [Salinivibrio]KKA44570.1 FMN-binding protein MioC [Salinivibrio sp. KP-1]MPS33358.1 FMN-binding protein MioC [Salinivibrio sp. VYel7]MPX91861.1 FMN-binding protein MioC [Salinivibrio sp. VYel1]MPX94742.1 FMN-binding protein MioC [Salinivibrio sp. VYel9]MPX97813.1 FMN-binding protein MioC [Salinivibrio sp. VYel6]